MELISNVLYTMQYISRNKVINTFIYIYTLIVIYLCQQFMYKFSYNGTALGTVALTVT